MTNDKYLLETFLLDTVKKGAFGWCIVTAVLPPSSIARMRTRREFRQGTAPSKWQPNFVTRLRNARRKNLTWGLPSSKRTTPMTNDKVFVRYTPDEAIILFNYQPVLRMPLRYKLGDREVDMCEEVVDWANKIVEDLNEHVARYKQNQ